MDTYYIELPRELTSYEFYNNLLEQKRGFDLKKGDEVILDFSKTQEMEPLTIPNMLCLGYELKKICDRAASVYIPDVSYSGKIKNYLKQINFLEYSEHFGLYNFLSSPYGGMAGKQIDPLCGTLYFDAGMSTDEISRGIRFCIDPFVDYYLYRFQNTIECEKKIYYENDITEFLKEMITNCKIHAKSFSFATLQARYSLNKIYIAVSDYGYGFSSTIGNSCDELSAIFEGVYKRKYSKVYGLYNVIRRVLTYGGKVRIHSNNTQVIFTPRILSQFIAGILLENESFRRFNIKKNLSFNGVHIEIELPLERRE